MESKNPALKNYAHWISRIHDLCNSYLKKTSEKMGRYDDKSKKTAPPFKAGDLVMLNGRNVRTRRAAKKLDGKLFGPFKVVKLVDRSGMSVELELPKRWRVHTSAKHKIIKKLSLLIFLLIPKIVSTKDFLLLPSAPGAS